MVRLSAVTFDLWQTLIIDSPEVGRPRAQFRLEGAREALRAQGFDCTREELAEASRRCLRICGEIREREQDVTFDEQVDIFLRGIDGGVAERISPETRIAVTRCYADSYLEHPPKVDESAAAVLHEVKGMGFKMGLICNTGTTPGVTQRLFLERIGLLGYFDVLTFSDEERLSKPATRIFHLTTGRLGVAPSQTVHLGDHPLNDVVGAKRAGLRAIWLRREEKEPELEPDVRIDSLGETSAALARLAAQLDRAEPST